MNKKMIFALFALAALTVTGMSGAKVMAAYADEPATIEDDLDDTSKMSDCYHIFAQNGDVGFGADNRYISTYNGNVKPAADTVWAGEDYGYFHYAVAGQNLLKVVCDEGADTGAPFVWKQGVDNLSSHGLELLKTEVQTSDNWVRRTYSFVIPSDATWIRIFPSSVGENNWSQQLTKVIISYLPEIVDDLDDTSKMSDCYHIFAQTGDVGFGADNRYISTYIGNVKPAADTVWAGEDYGYFHYAVAGHNLLKIVCDEGAECSAPFVWAQGPDNVSSHGIECLKTDVQASDNWTRKTYHYVIPEGTVWVRIFPSSIGENNWEQQLTKVELKLVPPSDLPKKGSTEITTIIDDLDDTSKMSDCYHIFAQSTDVGFGADNRYISTYNGNVKPAADTIWAGEDYGYFHYAVAGHNLLKVICDEGADYGAPFVWAQGADNPSSGGIECLKTDTQTSDNWTRRTYYYVIPEGTVWVRIFPSSIGENNWAQQLTRVEISKVDEKDLPQKEEPIDVPTIIDDFSEPKYEDAYGTSTQSADVGFGGGTRIITTLSPEEVATAGNWYEASYAYIQYSLSGQNLATVTVDIDPTVANIVPHIGFVTNHGGLDNRFLPVNNYSVETSSNWSRMTYKFIIPTGATWGRVVFTVYNSFDSRLQTWMQQVSGLKLEYVETTPEKDINIPVIEPIVKPLEPVQDVVETFDEGLEGNKNFSDFFSVIKLDFSGDSVIGTTKSPVVEPDSENIWGASYGYVDFKVDARHNLFSVTALVSDNALTMVPAPLVYAGQGTSLKQVAINNTVIADGQVDGLNVVTYNFVLTGQVVARVFLSIYNAPDQAFTTSDQLITTLKASAVEELPPADPVDTSHDAAIEAITTFVNGIDLSLYSEEGKALIKYYGNVAKHYIYHQTDYATDDAYVEAVKALIGTIKTLKQEQDEARQSLLDDFARAYASYSRDDYEEADFAKITKIYNDTLKEIETITDIAQITQILEDAKQDMASIKKKVIVTLSGISVSGAKVEFTVGDTFSSTGLVVSAKYSDGSTADVTDKANVDSSKVDMSKAGTYTVTVKFETATATYQVTVKEKGKDPKDPEPAKGGCGGSVIAASILVSSLAIAGLALISKKRKED